MKSQLAKRLVLLSVLLTIAAMLFMASSIIWPHPLLLVLAMSIGQGIALFALVLYLLAVALDLQASGEMYIPPEENPATPEPPGAEGNAPPAA